MHGGSNSLLQALDAGLPMVVVPLIADQFGNGAVASALQVAQVVQLGELTPATIQAAVREVLSNPAYRQNTARLRDEMHALPNIRAAVEIIEGLAAQGLAHHSGHNGAEQLAGGHNVSMRKGSDAL
jgi:UDP:flavonoid glycosyltransferase YjiC (YdhE family)